VTTFAEFALLASLGALGAVVRFVVMSLTPESARPFALLAVNAAGSALVGVALGGANAGVLTVSSLIAIGAFAAGLTTMSTLAVASAELIDHRLVWRGIHRAVQHIVVGAVFAWAGYNSASAILSA
jgi:fluoride ion exporter CrcB/FEX